MSTALTARYPDLVLPRVALGVWPTPVTLLERLVLTRPTRIWCKREDRAGTLYGGNKVRKLEYLLAAAHAAQTDIVTLGAAGSHHALATAIYGAEHGLGTHVVLVPQPDSPHARTNARITAAHATRVWAVPRTVTLPHALFQAGREVKRQTGRAPFRVPIGGSSPLGSLGHVALGLEIGTDVAAGRMPAPDQLFVALGTGGTAAGVWVGLRLAGLHTEVVGVRVVARPLCSAWRVKRLANRIAALLPEQPELTGFRIDHGHFGSGYGRPHTAGEAATRRLFDREGILLDPTYTAKAFAACLANIEAGETGSEVVFVMTVNSHPLDSLLATASAALPETVDGLFH